MRRSGCTRQSAETGRHALENLLRESWCQRGHVQARQSGHNEVEVRMSLVVMKFGGTSVEDPAAIGRTAAIVAGRVAAGKHARRRGQRHGQGHRPVAARRRRCRAGRPHRRAGHQFAAALAPSRHRLRAGQGFRPTIALMQPHRPEVRLARRNPARPGRHSRAHAAHLRPHRQLRRAPLQPHRRRRISPSAASTPRTWTRAKSSSPTRNSRRPIPIDSIIEKRAAEQAAPAARRRPRSR